MCFQITHFNQTTKQIVGLNWTMPGNCLFHEIGHTGNGSKISTTGHRLHFIFKKQDLICSILFQFLMEGLAIDSESTSGFALVAAAVFERGQNRFFFNLV